MLSYFSKFRINRPSYGFFFLLILNLALIFDEGNQSSNAEVYDSVIISDSIKLDHSLDNIHFANKVFNIKKPKSLKKIDINHDISDRGLTYGSGVGSSKHVDIGPPAFTSWAMLGSTLGHEIEVHCNQSFLFIWLSEMLNIQGTVYAERQAYQYEIRNAERFGLTVEERSQIASTKDYFYPVSLLDSNRPSKIKNYIVNLILSSK